MTDDAALPLRELITNAVRYWEPRRLLFNAVLLIVVGGSFAYHWPGSRAAITGDNLLGIFVLAVLANVAYCAAYLPDVALQYSGIRRTWLQWRWVLFVIGTGFAAVVAYFVVQNGFFATPD